jgi:hypothetical protein
VGARIVLRMLFEHGFFHAAPHPRNCFVEPGGPIGRIDVRRQYSPVRWLRRLSRSSREAAPSCVASRRLLGEIVRGSREIGMRPRNSTR